MNRLGAFPGRAVAGATVFLLFKSLLLPLPALDDIDSESSFLLLTSIFRLVPPCIRFLFITVPCMVFRAALDFLLCLDALLTALEMLPPLSEDESRYSSLTSMIPYLFSLTAFDISDLPRKKFYNIPAIVFSYFSALIDAFEDLLLLPSCSY